MTSFHLSRREFLRLVAASTAAGFLKPPPGSAQAQETDTFALRRPGDLAPHSVQLHIHANSNHNQGGIYGTYGAYQPASLQWHSDLAVEHAVETLWWSEHNQTLTPRTDFIVPLETGTLDRTTLNVRNLTNPYGQQSDDQPLDSGLGESLDLPGFGKPGRSARTETEIRPEDQVCCRHFAHSGPDAITALVDYAQEMTATITGDGTPLAQLQGNTLSWGLRNATTQGSFRYAPRLYGDQPIFGFILAKALLTDVQVNVDVWRGPSSTNQHYQIQIDLSYHWLNDEAVFHTLVYELVSAPRDPVVTATQVTVYVVVPAQTWTTIHLHPTQDAQLLLDGLDNTVQNISFTVSASRGRSALMKIRNLSVHSNQQNGSVNWQTGKSLAEGYMSRYPALTAIYGAEMQLQNSHLNAFLPRQTNQFPNPSQTREQFTAWVHSLGGMASFNHPFGANVSLDPNQAHQDQLVIETASDLLAAGVYGCDMIEAYTYRTCDLAHHLQLWDILTANGYNLLGIGTTDSHGGPWDEDYNYFVTWVWATGPDEDSLLAGMQSRALYFGSSFRFNEASLNYTAGGVSMGQVTTVNSNLATLNLQIAGFQPNWERRLRQYLVQPGLEIVNVVGTPQQPWIVLDGDTVDLDTSRSSFIRVEIWDTTDGKPVAFGQTIVLNREMRN